MLTDDIMFDSLICLWPLKNDDDLNEFENISKDTTKKRQCMSNIYTIIKKKNIYFMYIYFFYRK
jgi:hypothetical protein